jgi:hypothetical protein
MGKKITTPVMPPKRKGNTIAGFRVENIPSVRIPARIKAGFALMKKEGHAYLYNADFARLSGVSAADLNTYHEQFSEQNHELGNSSRSKLVWFATPALKKAALE